MSFGLYLIGIVLVIGGVAWGLITAGVRPLYVLIACVIMLGVGIVTAVTQTRSRDRSKDPGA